MLGPAKPISSTMMIMMLGLAWAPRLIVAKTQREMVIKGLLRNGIESEAGGCENWIDHYI